MSSGPPEGFQEQKAKESPDFIPTLLDLQARAQETPPPLPEPRSDDRDGGWGGQVPPCHTPRLVHSKLRALALRRGCQHSTHGTWDQRYCGKGPPSALPKSSQCVHPHPAPPSMWGPQTLREGVSGAREPAHVCKFKTEGPTRNPHQAKGQLALSPKFLTV